jgi:hypothetical protein
MDVKLYTVNRNWKTDPFCWGKHSAYKMWPPNKLEIFVAVIYEQKKGTETGPTSMPTLPPLNPNKNSRHLK